MKKGLFLFIVTLSSIALQAQSVNFRIGFKPNMTYKQTNIQSVQSEVGYGEGSEPTIQKNDMTMYSTTTTGKLAGTEMPVKMVL